MRHYFLSQTLRQVSSLGVLVDHVIEPSFHFCLDRQGLSLHVLHLLLDCRDALLKNGGVQHARLGEHVAHICSMAV